MPPPAGNGTIRSPACSASRPGPAPPKGSARAAPAAARAVRRRGAPGGMGHRGVSVGLVVAGFLPPRGAGVTRDDLGACRHCGCRLDAHPLPRRSSCPQTVERQARTPVRAHQGRPEGTGQGRGHGGGDRRPHRQQGAGAAWREQDGEPDLGERHLVGAPGRPALAQGEGGRTYDQLYAEAAKRNIKGRSAMNKDQLERAVGR